VGETPFARLTPDEQAVLARKVSRYVAGDLTRAERAEFESWLIASPELAAEVEMERRLRRGIARAARRGWLKRANDAHPNPLDSRRWKFVMIATLLFSLGLVAATFLLRR